MLRLSKLLLIALALSVFIGSVVEGNGSGESNKTAKRKLKILVFAPNGAFSHFNLMLRLIEILVERGHDLTVLMPDQNTEYKLENHNYKVIRVPAAPKPKAIEDGEPGRDKAMMSSTNRYIEKNLEEWVDLLDYMGADDGIVNAKNKDQMDRLKKENYDVWINEAWYFGAFAIPALLEIKTTIFTNAQPLYPALSYFLGLPHPDYIPELYSAKAGDGLGMTEERKKENELEYWHSIGVYTQSFNRANEQLNEIARDLYGWKKPFPKLQDIFRRGSYVFVNTNEALDFERPHSEQLNYFGGIAMRPGDYEVKAFKPETIKLIEKTKGKPIVLFSLGSAYPPKRMPREYVKAFLDAFAAFDKYSFLWKYETEDKSMLELLEEYPNVQVTKWFEQKNLLNLPETKAFISHCGMNSLNESAQFGVPIICIPLFADQYYNAAMAEYRGVGLTIQLVSSKGAITAKAIKEVLWEVLVEEKYSQNMAEIKDKINHPDITPAELFVSRVEAAAEVGDEKSETRIMGELPKKWTYISEKPGSGIDMFGAPPSGYVIKEIELENKLEEMEAQEKENVGAQSAPGSSTHKANKPRRKLKNSKKRGVSNQKGGCRDK